MGIAQSRRAQDSSYKEASMAFNDLESRLHEINNKLIELRGYL
jgi:hypothetical protein